MEISLRTHSNSKQWGVRLRHQVTIPDIKSKLDSKALNRVRRDLPEASQLIMRAYWALVINALEPTNDEDSYSQEDIEDLTDDLREFLNG